MSASTPRKTPTPALTTPIVLLMATATGLVVASNYYAQPLLHTISQQFGLSETAAGAIVMTAQLGYALGLMLLVPLGDMVERRSLIVVMTLLSACGLLISGFANSFPMLLIGTALTAILSVVAQVLVPFAATLAAPEQRGKAVGTVMSGLLLGILLARTVAGGLGNLGSWRIVYWVAFVLLVITAGALWRVLPRHKPQNHLSYTGLLASIFQLYAREPQFRARSLLGALTFAAFSMFWTPLTFLLASPPYSYSDGTIGLFGLAGAAGALAANRFGRLSDQGHGNLATRLGLALMAASWLLLALGAHYLAALTIGVVVLDMMIQGVHITNQTSLYRLQPEARGRLTAGYMTSYFLGGAAGSMAASALYAAAGWLAVCAGGALVCVIGLVYALCSPSARLPENHPTAPER
ncbi:MFS transporter [Bordetella sp. 15P40C-2]|uniref:MFS transporter n=1 Tax=Bordetella sp. 15P40C-2 TaxID=2572246 RepID=UPI00132627D3|nr:MFS transporter [Bordetella sp. 15P40C-2]MVW73641.1 MFS transporter [Bordetella sp. 15P40C-2]